MTLDFDAATLLADPPRILSKLPPPFSQLSQLDFFSLAVASVFNPLPKFRRAYVNFKKIVRWGGG
jgi:hypothetical protein